MTAPDEEALRSGDALIVAGVPRNSQTGGRRRRRRRDWRLGGESVRKWDAYVLSLSLVSLGVGAVLGAVLSRLIPTAGALMSSVPLWVGMGAAIVYAFGRSRPAGLLKLKPVDFLWALAAGLTLRVSEGWLGGAGGQAFPSLATLDGVPPSSWWIEQAAPAGLLAPTLEEFYFRAVLLIAVYQICRRLVGQFAAGVTAFFASSGAFVIVHGLYVTLSLANCVQYFLVGAACALMVLLSGRVWGAVLTHMVYNVSYLALVLAGTLLR